MVVVSCQLECELGADLLRPRARDIRVLFLGRRRDRRDAMFAAVGHAASGVCRASAAARVPVIDKPLR